MVPLIDATVGCRDVHNLAAAGAAVLVISQDLDELLALSHRLGVLHAGHLSRLRPTGELSIGEIGLLMGGVTTDSPILAENAA